MNEDIILLGEDLNPPSLESLIQDNYGDPEIIQFFDEWLKNGRNATAAYKAIHPNVTDESARVLGCRKLTKVNKIAIFSSYGLDVTTYMDQLKEGLNATLIENGQELPDLKTRRIYHLVLGKVFGFE